MCKCGSSNRPQRQQPAPQQQAVRVPIQQVQQRPTVIPNVVQGTNQMLVAQVKEQQSTQVIIQNRINAEAQKKARIKLWRL